MTGTVVNGPGLVCDMFNDYFVNTPLSIMNEIGNTPVSDNHNHKICVNNEF